MLSPEIKPPEVFVGRREELEWFERILFSYENWHQPHFVVGPAGVGKTALIAQFLARQGRRVTPLWLTAVDERDIDVALMDLDNRLRSESSPERERMVVVLDDFATRSPRDFDAFVHRILNYKRVRALIVSSRTSPTTNRDPVLTLAPLTKAESEELFHKLSSIQLPRESIDLIIARTGGYPFLIHIVAGVITTRGVEGLNEVLNGLLYRVTDDIPRGKIVTVAKPQLIIATNNLLEELKKQPTSVYDLPPRRFEELLAELLADQGLEVELTQETRDGGRDILAHFDTPVGRLLCLVDAKRYRMDRTVGVGLVRQLHGTLFDHKATNAMMVTTSKYSPDARAYQQRHKYQLSLKDYSDVVAWIQAYKQKARSGLILPS